MIASPPTASRRARLFPWVFGATVAQDFGPLAVGRDVEAQTAWVTEYAGDAIEALGTPRSPEGRTWAVVRRGGLLVVGTACSGQLVAGGLVRPGPLGSWSVTVYWNVSVPVVLALGV